MTLVRREMEDVEWRWARWACARASWTTLPAARERVAEAERTREAHVQSRHTAERGATKSSAASPMRTRRRAARNDLALAAERLHTPRSAAAGRSRNGRRASSAPARRSASA